MTEAAMGSNASHGQKQCETIGVGVFKTGDSSKNYKIRFVYNSRVVPRQVDALLARKPVNNSAKCQNVKSRTIWGSVNSANSMSSNCEAKTEKCNSEMVYSVVVNDPNVGDCDQRVSPVAPTGGGRRFNQYHYSTAVEWELGFDLLC